MRPADSSIASEPRHTSAFRRSLPTAHSTNENLQDGRAGAALPPVDVRVIGVDLDADDHTYLRRKLGARLAKFARSIDCVSVRFSDLNGPRGGIDQVCCVKVLLAGRPGVVVIRRDATPRAALDAALHASEHAVGGIVGRRRMKPLRAWSRRGNGPAR
jgi:putative sigma-54 modulation protein